MGAMSAVGLDLGFTFDNHTYVNIRSPSFKTSSIEQLTFT